MSTWLQSYLEAGNQDLENSLLSRMLVSRKLIPDLIPEYFTGKRFRLYQGMLDCWNKTSEIDPVYLKTTGYPDEIAEAVAHAGSSNIKTIEDLHELWQKREVAKVVLSAPNTFEDQEITTEQIIRRVQEGASKILLKNQDKKYVHYDSVSQLNKLIIDGNDNNREIIGYSTGLAELDRYTSGIERGKTYAIGALKKTGKSRFAIGLSIELRKQGASIVWDALEMSEMQLNLCALSNYAEIDSMKLGRKLTPEDMFKTQAAMGKLIELDWKIIREKTAPELRARIIELQNSGEVHVVVVDYIQRMNDKVFKGERAQEVESLAKALADIATECNVAVIVLTQLSKEAERLSEGEMPNMSHNKESQGLAESADCNITLHNPTRSELPYKPDGSYQLPEISCLVEQRYGLSGARFKILGDLRMCKFINHSNPYDK